MLGLDISGVPDLQVRCKAAFPVRLFAIMLMGNAQERLHAVERALPDCEVLLHAPSTLSRIVVRRKWSYICPANRRSAIAATQKPRQRP